MFLFCFPFDVFILSLRSRARNIKDAQCFVLIFVQFYQNLSFYLCENPILSAKRGEKYPFCILNISLLFTDYIVF